MTSVISVADIAQHEGQEVAVKGWLTHKTGKGKLLFLRVRDGSGFVQAVLFRPSVGDEAFSRAKKLTQESSLILTGKVKKDQRAPGIPGGYELDVSGIEVVQIAEPFPITPKEHGVDFLLDRRHLWLRSRRQWAILRIRATVIREMRNWLDGNGFVLVDTPILTPSAAEGTTTLFETDFHGTPAFLTQSGQLYNEANIFAFGKVYCFGPTFRAERSKTRRHLQEFWMLEPEVAFAHLEDLMEIEEQLVSHVVQFVLVHHAKELALLERGTEKLERVLPPFPRLSYDDAVEMLHAGGFPDFKWGDDFGSPHETYLTEQFDKPVFVHHFPSEAKAFYMEPEPGRPEVCRSADLLAPEGYGEIIGGSERMSDPEKLLAAIRQHNLPEEAYDWYLDLRRYGSVPHGGFGLGVERTLAWICKLPHVRETIPYPRLLDRFYP